MPLSLDPEWLAALQPLADALTHLRQPALHDIQTIRDNVEAVIPLVYADWPSPAEQGITQENLTFASHDGEIITVQHSYHHEGEATDPSAAILYLVGGGFVTGDIEHYAKSSANMAAESGLPVFTVGYRKAPEYPHPHPSEDAYAALKFVQDRAEEFKIDPARVMLFGESAGGGIAAAVALMARDRALSPPPAKQLLIFPMLDDRTTTANPLLAPFAAAGGWDYENNLSGWTALLGNSSVGGVGSQTTSPYAAPARAATLQDLPDAYVEVGELDIFRDEVLEYARRLMEAGVAVELHVFGGVPHGFVARAPGTRVAQAAVAGRLRALSGV